MSRHTFILEEIIKGVTKNTFEITVENKATPPVSLPFEPGRSTGGPGAWPPRAPSTWDPGHAWGRASRLGAARNEHVCTRLYQAQARVA